MGKVDKVEKKEPTPIPIIPKIKPDTKLDPKIENPLPVLPKKK